MGLDSKSKINGGSFLLDPNDNTGYAPMPFSKILSRIDTSFLKKVFIIN